MRLARTLYATDVLRGVARAIYSPLRIACRFGAAGQCERGVISW